uniref:AQP4 n=1 Tax=Eptatretus stoutii TaxID=7765 RepID=X5DRU5_EPTST|nr:AQP4 [Eptatretus stoutii]
MPQISRRCCSCCRLYVMPALQSIWNQTFLRALLAEFLGTALLVIIGVGSATGSQSHSDLHIALAFGLAIVMVVQAVGHVSGAHVNPAVTISMLCAHRISLFKAIGYVAAQCLGAMLGGGLLRAVSPFTTSFGVTKLHTDLGAGRGVLVEAIITFALVLTVFASTDEKRTDLLCSPALPIGLTVAVGHLFAIPYTGSSMNPARSLGSAVVSREWPAHWVYWVGPILGGLLACGIYEYLLYPNPQLKHRIREACRRSNDVQQVSPGSSEKVQSEEIKMQHTGENPKGDNP